MNELTPLQKFWADVKSGRRPRPERQKGRPPVFTVQSSKHWHGIADQFRITIHKSNGTIEVRERGRRKVRVIDVADWYMGALRKEAGIRHHRR